MKAVIISEERFNSEFERAANELTLAKFEQKDRAISAEDMHRRFTYVLFTMKDRLKDSSL